MGTSKHRTLFSASRFHSTRLLSYEVGSSALLFVIDGKDGRTGSRPIIRTNGLNPVEALDAVLYAYSTNGRFPSHAFYIILFCIAPKELQQGSIKTFYHSITLRVVCCCSGLEDSKCCTYPSDHGALKVSTLVRVQFSGIPNRENKSISIPAIHSAVWLGIGIASAHFVK